MLTAAGLANYRERVLDLTARYKWLSASAAASSSDKRKREDEKPESASLSYQPPPFKRPKDIKKLVGYNKGDDSLRKLEGDPRYDLITLVKEDSDQLMAQMAKELGRTESDQPAQPEGQIRGLKRKHEEEEQEDDRPRKSMRVSSPPPKMRWLAGRGPGAIHRHSNLKGGFAPTVPKTNVARYSSADHVRDRSVRFDLGAGYDATKEKYGYRSDGRYRRGRFPELRHPRYQPGKWAPREGHDFIDTSGFRDQAWPGKVRFKLDTDHDETKEQYGYRPNVRYKRSHPFYRPGKWAPQEEDGFVDTSGFLDQHWPSTSGASGPSGHGQTGAPSNNGAMVASVSEQPIAQSIINEETAARRPQEEEAQELEDDPTGPLFSAWRKCAKRTGRIPWVGRFMPSETFRNRKRHLEMKLRILLTRFQQARFRMRFSGDRRKTTPPTLKKAS